jgi:hypothetical protein
MLKKVKVSELIGPALDWAVECIESQTVPSDWACLLAAKSIDISKRWAGYTPSTDWAQGGPILDREKIAIDYDSDWGYDSTDSEDNGDRWIAQTAGYACYGPTPLIAVMRVYVANKLGTDEIEIPEELLS